MKDDAALTLERPPKAQDTEPLDEGTSEHLALEIRIESRPPLRFFVRVGIFIVGWLLILVGVAGLVLPALPGVVTILLGAALLSLDNELVYRGLRRLFTRWPHLWDRVENFREKAHDRIHRMFHRRAK